MVIGRPGQVGQHVVLSADRWEGENVTIRLRPMEDIIVLELTMTQMIVLEGFVGGVFGLSQVLRKSQQKQHLLLQAKLLSILDLV